MKSIPATHYNVEFIAKNYQVLTAFIASKNYSSLYILVDSNTEKCCLPYFLSTCPLPDDIEVISMDAGEEHKHLNTCMGVWESLSELGADRKSLLLNLGGGVVTDLGGFVASTFKRGIDFINIPTTLLSMVDASVGGKTGVDLGPLKNQIGVINSPKMVIVDTHYLETLPGEEYRSGYAEMLKHGLIRDKKYWEILANYSALNTSDLKDHIHHSVGIKNEVVTEDPFEEGLRKILNFGHTLGHAVESFFLTEKNKTTLLHGEAIAIGMVLEAYLSHKLCGLTHEECNQIKETFKAIYPHVNITKQDIEAILALLIYDKKNSHGKVKFVLLEAIGKPVLDVVIEENLLWEAFDYYSN